MSSAVAASGKRQRPMTAVTKKRIATTAAMIARMARPGIVAFTPVYAAPVMRSSGSTSVLYWSSQRLAACTSR